MKGVNFKHFLVLLSATLLLSSCSVGPKEIDFGTDNCDYCQMTISDERFGAEVVTKKGRIYKFDDLHCLKSFVNDDIVENENVHSLWTVDFASPKSLIAVDKSNFVLDMNLRSPMGSNIAAFSSLEKMKEYLSNNDGKEVKWEEYLQSN
jgi:copper chaperone NosL